MAMAWSPCARVRVHKCKVRPQRPPPPTHTPVLLARPARPLTWNPKGVKVRLSAPVRAMPAAAHVQMQGLECRHF